jgi:hypothetical protein
MYLLAVALVLLPLGITFAEPGFDQKYERDYNISTPTNQYRPDNAQAYAPNNPFNPMNRLDPGNPANPLNRFNSNNPFNPINAYNPKNPLNATNESTPSTPFRSLGSPSGATR